MPDSFQNASPPGGPGWFPWIRGLVVVVACTGVSELIYPGFDAANVIMVYLGGVVYVALNDGVRVSVAVVVASIFCFNLLFVEPRWGLNPLNPSHFFTFAVMLAVGLLIGHLAERARTQTSLARVRAERAQAMADLSAELARSRGRPQVEQALCDATRRHIGMDSRVQAAGDKAPPGFVCLPLSAGGDELGFLCVKAGVLDEIGGERELLGGFAAQGALALQRCESDERRAEAMIQAEAERLRSTVLAGISHDFRTPLTTIVGAATSLIDQEERLDAPQRRSLARGVLEEARRLHHAMSDLLDITRLEEGAVQLQPEWCPADDLVAEAIAVLDERRTRHRIREEVPADAVVWCDARMLEQALVNIVDNALRHTPPGSSVVVRVTVEPGWWTLAVQDDGPGFGAAIGPDLFRKFTRGNSEPAGSGFGLGLAICAAVARLHGGTIHADDAPGARVTMRLPQPDHVLPGGEPEA